jgi:hypothetical protein
MESKIAMAKTNNHLDALQERMASLRAGSLLRVELLRESNVAVLETGEKGWPDIVACLLDDGINTGKLFAIQIIASWEDIRDYHLNDFTFPIAIFVYDKKKDSFLWNWIVSPESDGSTTSSNTALQSFTPETMRQLIDQVSTFYKNRKFKVAA